MSSQSQLLNQQVNGNYPPPPYEQHQPHHAGAYKPTAPPNVANNYDAEDPTMGSSDDGVKGFDFSEESIRKGFIRKVYFILTVSIYTYIYK